MSHAELLTILLRLISDCDDWCAIDNLIDVVSIDTMDGRAIVEAAIMRTNEIEGRPRLSLISREGMQ